MIFLFQDTTSFNPPGIDRLVEVSPYNALGYGAALLILAYVSYTYYTNWKEAQAYAKDLSLQIIQYNKDVLQVMTKVELRLSDQQAMKDEVRDMRASLSLLLKHSEEIINRIETRMDR